MPDGKPASSESSSADKIQSAGRVKETPLADQGAIPNGQTPLEKLVEQLARSTIVMQIALLKFIERDACEVQKSMDLHAIKARLDVDAEGKPQRLMTSSTNDAKDTKDLVACYEHVSRSARTQAKISEEIAKIAKTAVEVNKGIGLDSEGYKDVENNEERFKNKSTKYNHLLKEAENMAAEVEKKREEGRTRNRERRKRGAGARQN